jgi:large subunit ribosomal protein L21
MYAVIRTGGKQYRVSPGDVIEVEKLSGEAGEIIQLSQVLMLGGEGSAQIGAPTVSGASVAAEVIAQKRGTKVIVFKKKRRKSYRRKRGHRQHLTALRITEILTGGKKPSQTAAKPAAAKKQAKTDAKKAEQKKPEAKPAAAKPKAKAQAKKPATKKPAAKKPAAKK